VTPLARWIVDGLVAGLLAAWFAASVLNQFSLRWFTAVQRRDRLSLLPRWTFFAPNPGVTDYRLLYREQHPDGEVSDWRPVPTLFPRGPATALWNPRKRRSKAVTDVVAGFRTMAIDRASEDAFKLSPGYLALLNVVNGMPPSRPAVARQFMVEEREGFVRSFPPRLLLRSDMHRL
jgi:hypothetical protein